MAAPARYLDQAGSGPFIQRRWVLTADAGALAGGRARVTRLLGPYDLYLQLRDRSSLVDDTDRAKALWPVLGRPGAVLHNGEIAGIWRPRKSGKRLSLAVSLWTDPSPQLQAAVGAQAERLAAFRGVEPAAVEVQALR